MLVCIVFLIGAGLIEGYISPNPAYSLTVRVLVGVAYWLVFLFVMSGCRLNYWSRRADKLVATPDVAACAFGTRKILSIAGPRALPQ